MGGFFPSKTLIMFPVLYVLLDNIYILLYKMYDYAYSLGAAFVTNLSK